MSETLNEEYALADALAKCPTLDTKQSRDDCVMDLPDTIKGNITRGDTLTSDLRNIVRACVQYPDEGIKSLLEIVRFREKDSPPMTVVEKLGKHLEQKLRAALGSGEGSGERAAESVVSRSEKRYALVIGISNYRHQQPAGNELKEKEFTQLSFAANDAADFAAFLKEDKRYDVGPPLMDDQAGLKQILHSLDDLRKRSSQSENPLVIVFFSGHGARDEDGRHYLIPHDAERDNLFSTALWSKTFDNALGALKTDRLAVFLDACHSGGIGTAEDKHAALVACDPGNLVVESPNQRRFVVASCMAGQRSRELEEYKKGIFTHHLLQLLRCETGKEFESEEVDLWDLCSALKEKVKLAAGTPPQEPYTNFDKKTGIVVTINQSLRERRISKEWVYLKALVEEITASGTNLKTRIRVTLNELIEDGSREAGLDEFYDYFKESAAIWRSGDKARVAQDCKRLIKFYGGAVASPVKTFAAAPASTAPSQLPAKGDGLDSNSPKEKTCPETSGTVRPSSQSMAQKAVKRLRLTEEERRFVREPIWTGAFRRQALELDKCLKQLEGVSQEDIMDWQSGCEPARVELDLFNTQCDMVALRLTELFEEKSQENERSPQPPMMVTNVLGVRTGQD